MTTAAETLESLCLAIDQGDDAVLPILADLLEDRGDMRAAGMRLVGDRRPAPLHGPAWGWLAPGWNHPADCAAAVLPRETYQRLPGRRGRSELALGASVMTVIAHRRPTRSAAYLALAEALSHP